MSFLKALLGSPPKGASERDEVELRGNGAYDLEVKGESSYQANIAKIVRDADGNRHALAMLLLDDNNPHDRNAVRVEINGLLVGHLSQEVAPIYRQQLKEKGHPRAVAMCEARIAGGTPNKPAYGVWLDVPVKLDED